MNRQLFLIVFWGFSKTEANRLNYNFQIPKIGIWWETIVALVSSSFKTLLILLAKLGRVFHQVLII